MRVANQQITAVNNKPTFSKAVLSDSIQNLIQKSVADKKAAARLTGTLVSVVASNPTLQECAPATVIAAAVHGEGMGLTIGQGYYIVPYGNTAKFTLGYKGMIQLAIATGLFADMDCVPVREGEIVGRDPKTKRHIFDFSVYSEDEEDEHEIVGYMAYAQLKDGYYRYEYMTVDKLLKRADTYSSAFSLERFNKLKNGELNEMETKKLKKSSPWYDTDGGQEVMFKKSVLRKLLTSGYLPIASDTALTEALNADKVAEEGFIPDIDMSMPNNNSTVQDSNASTSEAKTVVVEAEPDPIDEFFKE